MKRKPPHSIEGARLLNLYKEASGECPTIRDPKGTPCGKGRFGCWTCTVVRKDRAMTSMVAEGHSRLEPLLAFRNWLVGIRDDKKYRHCRRRNGQVGLGPFRLSARKLLLKKLLTLQRKTGFSLISRTEIRAIKDLWKHEAPEFC